jgi:hypothetical protein
MSRSDVDPALIQDSALHKSFARKAAFALLTSLMLLSTAALTGAQELLVVSRIQYDGNTFGNPANYPYIFNDPTVSGVQGSIHLDVFAPFPHVPALFSFPLSGITTSFSSKSEGALTRSVDHHFLTYIGYDGPDGDEGVSNSYTTAANLAGNTLPLFDREVALISADGSVSLTPQSNAYSGDNPRAVITVDGTQFYMAGNSDSTIAKDGTGPGTTIGARYGTPGSNTSYQLGVYFASDRPDETAKQHVKDNNFRGIGIYNGNLYTSKGSGGNGDDGIFKVEDVSGHGLPTGTGNTIVHLLGAPATDPVTGNPSPFTPFGFFFANPKTLYVADEGYPNTDANGNLIPDPLAGLEKWSLVNGTWQLDYVIQDGLNLLQPANVPGYPVPTYTYGLRNMTGRVDEDGTVTIYAITSQYSTFSGGEPDPTNLVVVKDRIASKKLETHHHLDHFETLQNSGYGHVFRGVAFVSRPGDE